MKLVLDTNIVLDLFVFDDAAGRALRSSIEQREVEWIATPAMRDELSHVLAYPAIAARMEPRAVTVLDVLALFDKHVRLVDSPAQAKLLCSDPDDQKFVDLAVAHGAALLSKDKALLALRRKLPVSSSFSQ